MIINSAPACPVVSLIVGRSHDLWAAFAGLSGYKRCVYIALWLLGLTQCEAGYSM